MEKGKKTKLDIHDIDKSNKEQVEAFFEENIGLVGTVVKKYINKGVPYEDLMQIGSEFLFLAILRFDVTKESKFSSYAFLYIQGGIQRYLREKTNLLKIPRDVYVDVYRYRRFVDLYDESEIQEKMGLEDKKYNKVKYAADNLTSVTSLEQTLSSDTGDGLQFQDTVASDKNVEEEVISNVMCESILQSIKDMGWRYEDLVRRRLNGETLGEIAKAQNVSKAYVGKMLQMVARNLKMTLPELDIEGRSRVGRGRK